MGVGALKGHFSARKAPRGPDLPLTEPAFGNFRAFWKRIGYLGAAVLNGLFTRSVNHCPDRP